MCVCVHACIVMQVYGDARPAARNTHAAHELALWRARCDSKRSSAGRRTLPAGESGDADAGKDEFCAFRTGFLGRDLSDPEYSASFFCSAMRALERLHYVLF